MKHISCLSFILCCFLLSSSQLLHAQPQPDATLPGTWKGTSVCQVKNSPCNNEIVVCHISATKIVNKFTVVMNKMVSGEEEEMGTLEGVFDPKTKLLSLTPKENIKWSFQLEGRELKGTLY